MDTEDSAWKARSHFLPGMSSRSQAIQSFITGNPLQSSCVPYFWWITRAHSWTPHPRKLFLVEEKNTASPPEKIIHSLAFILCRALKSLERDKCMLYRDLHISSRQLT